MRINDYPRSCKLQAFNALILSWFTHATDLFDWEGTGKVTSQKTCRFYKIFKRFGWKTKEYKGHFIKAPSILLTLF